MSELGGFLEIVFGTSIPFRSIRCTTRQWGNRGLAESAQKGRSAIGRRKIVDDQGPTIDEAQTAIWFQPPSQWRVERTGQVQGQAASTLAVVNGERWWNRNRHGVVATNDGQSLPEDMNVRPGMNEIDRHFNRASFRECFVGLSLEQAGAVQTAGRNCIRVRGVPRPDARLWPHWLPYGADEYEFHADVERGLLLFVAGLSGGKMFELTEVQQIFFDEPLDESLFNYAPQPGEQLCAAVPIVERMSLATAATRMSFVVLIPGTSEGEAGNFEVMYHPPQSKASRAHLALMFRGSKMLWINESDAPDPASATMEWESFEHDGKPMAISDPGTNGGMKMLELELHGTHVTIMSNLQRDELIRIAASLTPAT